MHATEALRHFLATCNTITSGGAFRNGRLFVRAQGVREEEVRSHPLSLALAVCAVFIFRCDFHERYALVPKPDQLHIEINSRIFDQNSLDCVRISAVSGIEGRTHSLEGGFCLLLDSSSHSPNRQCKLNHRWAKNRMRLPVGRKLLSSRVALIKSKQSANAPPVKRSLSLKKRDVPPKTHPRN